MQRAKWWKRRRTSLLFCLDTAFCDEGNVERYGLVCCHHHHLDSLKSSVRQFFIKILSRIFIQILFRPVPCRRSRTEKINQNKKSDPLSHIHGVVSLYFTSFNPIWMRSLLLLHLASSWAKRFGSRHLEQLHQGLKHQTWHQGQHPCQYPIRKVL